MASAAASPVKQLLGLVEFRRFMGASTLTSLTFGTTRFAAVWAMGDLTDWDPALGLLGVALGMPALLFSPLFGALADRFDRRHVAGASTLAVGTGCAIIAVLLATDTMNPVGLGVAAFLVSIPLAGVSPALQAMVPTLAPRAMLMNAVALQNLAMMGSMVVGAFVGGLAITLSGTSMAFAIMAGVTVLAFLQLLRLPAAAGQVGTQTPPGRSPGVGGPRWYPRRVPIRPKRRGGGHVVGHGIVPWHWIGHDLPVLARVGPQRA